MVKLRVFDKTSQVHCYLSKSFELLLQLYLSKISILIIFIIGSLHKTKDCLTKNNVEGSSYEDTQINCTIFIYYIFVHYLEIIYFLLIPLMQPLVSMRLKVNILYTYLVDN